MKKLLLITGDLAAGKSTFANMLSQRYNINVFFKDSIKEILGETIGFSNREENLRLSDTSIKLMLFIFQEFAKLSKNLILESNFHTQELDRLHKIASENDYEVLTLVIRGDIDVLYKRYINRMQNEKRHPVHLSTTLNVYDDFRSSMEQNRMEYIPGNILEINADDFSYQTDKKIIKTIDDFICV